ncbi:PDZ domain-containing protein [Cyanobacteria bacterium FACHB-DQ100]|uniref:carboxyl-terminal processing protease CtpB n=1 Tax=unclassified Leptolyngbya TaxID=2650499 RepID=UPI0016818633|nr:carboxyl-terminal processing protease CtpB [Leptolyngbya sp. FACHB-17]MBD1824981.1 PDZ domain-containing protein [Cyanobacteria bacterium FACHB-DQ100]MBD2080686.1 PDZ domain-containing protein [Leptolyngbya sp. FACHB-17]
MNRPTRRVSLLQVALCSGVIAATAAGTVFNADRSVKAALQDSPKSVLDEAWQIVNREYVDGSFNKNDWNAVRQTLLSRNYSSRQQAYTALRDALKKLDDPYTRFMDPKQFEALSSQTSGELSGVGIRLEQNEKTKVLTVVEPLENSPAIRAGIKTGDRILAINGKTTKGMTVEDASNLIRGEVGTKVTLQIQRDGASAFNMPLTRARIELQAVRASVKQEGKNKVGYIRLGEFSSHAAEQMERAIKNLSAQKVDAFVLDLRGNPGGLLQASIDISRMWLDKGAIVKTVNRQGVGDTAYANGRQLSKLPLVVLVDGRSASSSEILTGALKDNKRATIVGSQTFGKALVQSVHSLSDGSGVAVTIAHYYTPKGTDISQKGVTPDIKVDLSDAQQKFLATNPKLIGTTQDPQYARALNLLERTAFAKPGGQQTSQQPAPAGRE